MSAPPAPRQRPPLVERVPTSAGRHEHVRGPAIAPDGPGYGIAGVRERVALLGGRFAAGARPAGGFRVEARLPVPEPREQPGNVSRPASVPASGSAAPAREPAS